MSGDSWPGRAGGPVPAGPWQKVYRACKGATPRDIPRSPTVWRMEGPAEGVTMQPSQGVAAHHGVSSLQSDPELPHERMPSLLTGSTGFPTLTATDHSRLRPQSGSILTATTWEGGPGGAVPRCAQGSARSKLPRGYAKVCPGVCPQQAPMGLCQGVPRGMF